MKTTKQTKKDEKETWDEKRV